jgi:hypothetical protein
MSRPTSAEHIHERARTLAATAIDVKLEAFEAAWLAEHLKACAECREVAAEYRAIHDELRSLKEPLPPRDLWARTSAALDAVDRAAAARTTRSWLTARLAFDRPLSGSVVAVGLVVLIAAVSLLTQGPLSFKGSGGGSGIAVTTPGPEAEAPFAYFRGTGYFIDLQGDTYQIKGRSAECSGGERCAVPKTGGETLGSIQSKDTVSAAIAPNASLAAVWTASKVVILPLDQPTPLTVSIDDLTPRPVPSVEPTAVPTALPSPTEAGQAATPGETSSAGPSATESAAASPAVTPTATAASTSPPATGQPLAILDGYEIIGRDPTFSADGSWVAFSARPVDGSTGPDVFVWRTGQERAEAITSRHADLFAGWYGRQILMSEFGATGQGGRLGAASYLYDPQTGATQRIDQPMLLPVADPTGRFLVYWDGTVRLNASTGLWEPVQGNLYFDSWADLTLTPASLEGPLPTATPTASPTASPEATSPAEGTAAPETTATVAATALDGNETQTPAPTPSLLPQVLPVHVGSAALPSWVVSWDAGGRHLAVWVAGPAGSGAGTVSLFAVDRAAGLVQTSQPLMAADNVLPNLQFDDSHLICTSNADRKTYLVPVPEMAPTPSAIATPTPQASPTPESSAEQAPPPTDLPGS